MAKIYDHYQRFVDSSVHYDNPEIRNAERCMVEDTVGIIGLDHWASAVLEERAKIIPDILRTEGVYEFPYALPNAIQFDILVDENPEWEGNRIYWLSMLGAGESLVDVTSTAHLDVVEVFKLYISGVPLSVIAQADRHDIDVELVKSVAQ